MRPPLYWIALALMLPLTGCHREEPKAEAAPRPTLSFYLVSAEKIPGGRYMDTPDLPKLGYISGAPDLVVTGLEAAIPSAMPPGAMRWDKEHNITSGGEKSRAAMLIKLHDKDAKELALLTEHAAGRKLLMMLGETPLMVQEFKGAIPGGKLLLAFDEKKDKRKIQDDLEEMAK